MGEHDENQTPQPLPPEDEENAPITYATPTKRVWAWVGVGYMLIFLASFTYFLATLKIPGGMQNLMIAPAMAGLGVSVLLRQREAGGNRILSVALALVAFAAAVAALSFGVMGWAASMGVNS